MAQESWKKETDETECQTPEGPVLCANHCGFFGSATTNNLCSKCYNMFMKQQQQQLPLPLVTAPVMPLMGNAMASSSITCQSIAEKLDMVEEMRVINIEGSSSESMSDKEQSKRCLACRRRVGLAGFKCRCGGTFCSTHRYSETHECSFDYRTAGREAIAKANPVVKAAKIEKI